MEAAYALCEKVDDKGLKAETLLHEAGLFDEMEGIKKGILKGFLELDEKLRKIPEVASGEDKSGTTAVCALISQKYLIIANCGDSRGVCCTLGKPALATQVRIIQN